MVSLSNHGQHRLQQACQRSGSAKRLMHNLIGTRRFCMAREAGLILIGRRQHGQQGLERLEIAAILRRRDRLLDQMIARDEGRICRTA